jgi:hypothetical protein
MTDQKPQKRWQCRFGFHLWTRWEVSAFFSGVPSPTVVAGLIQQRSCEACGLLALRKDYVL